MMALLAALALTAATAPASAQNADTPVRIVLPFPAGGAVHFLARTVVARMSEDLGTPIAIANKAGASGIEDRDNGLDQSRAGGGMA